ncbi:TPA: hypothetical protein N0F65_004329 [Lagenidium giganteum]|uniref:Uncharacterized protein n=1 Tax=Lagenidium giganteum TaxID=4803 RepID=A0AAV2YL77_9STRA|nr:TPA: hypothetical protein N0F65_004329 [Lagenidium giganteum]
MDKKEQQPSRKSPVRTRAPAAASSPVMKSLASTAMSPSPTSKSRAPKAFMLVRDARAEMEEEEARVRQQRHGSGNNDLSGVVTPPAPPVPRKRSLDKLQPAHVLTTRRKHMRLKPTPALDARQVNAGVYMLRNDKTGHAFFGTTWDLQNAAAQSAIDLAAGTHPHEALARCYQLYGADSSGIRFVVLEQVQLQSTRVFDVTDLEALLQHRLAVHQRKHVRRSASKLVQRMLVLPFLAHYWPRWTGMVQDATSDETLAAMLDVQRVARGWLARRRTAVLRRLRAAAVLQRFLRLCLVKRLLGVRHTNEWRHHCAAKIQRCHRRCLARQRADKRRLQLKQWFEARKVQRIYRGYRGRRAFIAQRRALAEQRASVVVQRLGRGFLARRHYRLHRRRLQETHCAEQIQRHWRGMQGRARFRAVQNERKDRGRRDLAASRIQAIYWRHVRHKMHHVATRYTVQVKQVATIQAAYKNYLAKKFGWAAMTYALETTMARRLQRACSRWLFFLRLRRYVQYLREHQAAMQLQRAYRGRLARKLAHIERHALKQRLAATRIQMRWHVFRCLQRITAICLDHKRNKSAAKIQRYWHVFRCLQRVHEIWMDHKREKSALLIQTLFRGHRKRQIYLVARDNARRERAATNIQCAYRLKCARREWQRRLNVKRQGPCQECGDKVAMVFCFDLSLELCFECLEIWKLQDPVLTTTLRTVDVQLYRQQQKAIVHIQRVYRGLQVRWVCRFGICAFCESKAVRKFCWQCRKVFCHSCVALFHENAKLQATKHRRLTVEHLRAMEVAARLVQKHVRRFLQRNTLPRLRLARDNAAATKVQRAYWSHRQRRITQALVAAKKKRQEDEQCAATTIQRRVRRFLARLALLELRVRHHRAITIQRVFRGHAGRLTVHTRRTRRSAAIVIQRNVRAYRARVRVALLREQAWQRKQHAAATTIQRHVRGFVVRRRQLHAHQRYAAQVIQCAWRKHAAQGQFERLVRERNARRKAEAEARLAAIQRHAATTIQCIWRRHYAQQTLARLRIERARRLRQQFHARCLALEQRSACKIQAQARRKLTLRNGCATRIQCAVRCMRSRQRVQQLRRRRKAAVSIQRAFRYSRAKKKLSLLVRQETLPSASWVELFDEASGYVYYFNPQTKETAWERPPEMEIATPEQETEWVEYWDENVGTSYYYNTKTGEATWAVPEELETTVAARQSLLESSNQLQIHGLFNTMPPPSQRKLKQAGSSSSLDDNWQWKGSMTMTQGNNQTESEDPTAAYQGYEYQQYYDQSGYEAYDANYQDLIAYYQDPNAHYQDPNAYYQDQNAYYQDPNAYYQDPNAYYYQDPNAYGYYNYSDASAYAAYEGTGAGQGPEAADQPRSNTPERAVAVDEGEQYEEVEQWLDDDDTPVDTEYGTNYQIFVTQLERDREAMATDNQQREDEELQREMKFGKRLIQEAERSPPAWAPFWLDYKGLKKRINMVKSHPHMRAEHHSDIGSSKVAVAFFKKLEEERRKIARFYVVEERRHVAQYAQFRSRWRDLRMTGKGFTDIAAVQQLMFALMHFYRECLQLEHFALLNYQAFSKIVKKHDKLTGFRTRAKYMRSKVNSASFATVALLLHVVHQAERLFFELDEHVHHTTRALPAVAPDPRMRNMRLRPSAGIAATYQKRQASAAPPRNPMSSIPLPPSSLSVSPSSPSSSSTSAPSCPSPSWSFVWHV